MDINELVLVWSLTVCIVYILQEHIILKTFQQDYIKEILHRSILIIFPIFSYLLHIYYQHPLLSNIFYFIKIMSLFIISIFIILYRFPQSKKILKPLYIIILIGVLIISNVSELLIQIKYYTLSNEILISQTILYGIMIAICVFYFIFLLMISIKTHSYILYLIIYSLVFIGLFIDMLCYIKVIELRYTFDLLIMTAIIFFLLRNFDKYNTLKKQISSFLDSSINMFTKADNKEIKLTNDDFNEVLLKDLFKKYLKDGELFQHGINYFRVKSNIYNYIQRLEKIVNNKTLELNNYKDKYKQFYDQASFIYLTFDFNGKIIELNKHAEELLKYPREKIINKNILSFIQDSVEKELLRDILNHEISVDNVENLELALISIDSKDIIVHSQLAVSKIIEDDIEINVIDCVMKEITNQVKLKKKNEIISNISKLAANKKEIDKLLIFYAKEIEKEIDFEELNIRILGGNPEQIFRIKKTTHDNNYSMSIHFDRPIDNDYLNTIMKNKDYIVFNPYNKDKILPILTTKEFNTGLLVILSYGENIRAVLEILSTKNVEWNREHIDIILKTVPILSLIFEFTDLFRKISYSENRYRNIVESSYDAIIILDEFGNIRELNNSAYRLLQWDIAKHGNIIGKNINRFLIEDIHFTLLKKNYKQSFRELKLITKEKNELTVEINLIKSTIEGNIQIYCVVNDITEKYNQEVQLIQASKMATLGEMSTSVAHELNQPLNNIGIIAQRFIKKVEKGDFEKDFFISRLDLLMGQIKRASKIINHMREFGRISDRRVEKTNVNQPIKNIFNIISEQLKIYNVEVALNLDENIPPIMANPNRLEQILLNIINNARDAMKEKKEKRITIITKHDEEFVYIDISDTGVGMDEKLMHKIFEPFFTTKEIGKGTGLGLSISYNLIKDYNGDIKVKSKPNIGTTFSIRFPLVVKKKKKDIPV